MIKNFYTFAHLKRRLLNKLKLLKDNLIYNINNE